MNIDNVRDDLQDMATMSTTLGMKFMSTPDPDTCMGTMAVDRRTRQPFGVLCGGATLALAETLAGIGSLALCPGERFAGVNVSGNHVKAALDGDTVTATARIVHRGHLLHVWSVEVRNSAGELISTVSVTNCAVTNKPKES